MNYREKIRKAIECPQFGNETYGEWGILNLEQRNLIKRLLDELDSADNYFKKVYLENKQLKIQISAREEVCNRLESNWNKLKEYFNERIEVCDNRLSSPFCNFEKATKEKLIFTQCLEKLEELEQGSDSNE